MILIIANRSDPHVPCVTSRLETRGASYLRFDPQDFPPTAQIALRYDRCGSVTRTLNYGGRQFDLAEFRCAWYRGRARPEAAAAAKEENKSWISEISSRFLAELWECLDCFWVPNRPIADRDPHREPDAPDETHVRLHHPPSAKASPYNKQHQLAVASELGFAVPRTLITNNPAEFLDFYSECNGQVVSKNVTALRISRDGEYCESFTYPIQRRDVVNYMAVQYAPVTFQERVPKHLELRVTVVGDRVFAAAIRSQSSRPLQHDWRHYQDLGGKQFYLAHTLPPEVAQRCVRLVEQLGLCFGAIDLILTPDQQYVFLEVNPNGQWAWIEIYTGLPIADALADMLVRGRSTHEIRVQQAVV